MADLEQHGQHLASQIDGADLPKHLYLAARGPVLAGFISGLEVQP